MFDSFIAQLHAPALAVLATLVLVLLVGSGGTLVVPNGSTRLGHGDVLTLTGGEAAVNAAREKLDGIN